MATYLKKKIGRTICAFGMASATFSLTACTVWHTYPSQDPGPTRGGEEIGGWFDRRRSSDDGKTVVETRKTVQTTTVSAGIDRSRTHSGIPYFLPKGVMHLTIKPAGGGGNGGGSSSSATTATSATANATNTLTNTLALPQLPEEVDFKFDVGSNPMLPKSGNVKFKLPDGPSSPPGKITYQVNAEVKMVPDTQSGVLYAHYSPNWLFADNVSITVSSDGLLSAVNSSVEDRTPQIIDNLAETAVNIGQFLTAMEGIRPTDVSNLIPSSVQDAAVAAAPGFAAQKAQERAAFNAEAKTTPVLDPDVIALQSEVPQVIRLGKRHLESLATKIKAAQHQFEDLPKPPYIKRLNVDETFDPLRADQASRVESLFLDEVDETGHTVAYSPLRVKVVPRRTARGVPAANSGARLDGLWFRELREVRIDVTINRRLIARLTEMLEPAEAALRAHQVEARQQGAEINAIKELLEDNRKQLEALDGRIAAAQKRLVGNVDNLVILDALHESAFGQTQADKVGVSLAGFATDDFDTALKAYGAFAKSLQGALQGSYPGEQAGLGNFTAMVPDKEHSFSMTVPRSAFVARTMQMTIDRGILLGFTHNKPSEVEGFSTIPLNLAKKLAGVPKALITSKDEAIQANTSLTKSKQAAILEEINLQKVKRGIPLPATTTTAAQ